MKNSTLNIKGIALAISFFGLFACCSSIAHSQTITWHGGGAACFGLTVSATQTSCGQTCSGSSCDHCATLDISNNTIVGNPCDITELDISSSNSCYSVCCPAAYGSPNSNSCDGNLKWFSGHFPQGSAPASFTICYSGLGPVTFTIYEAAGTGAGCCTHIVGSDNNYYTVTF